MIRKKERDLQRFEIAETIRINKETSKNETAERRRKRHEKEIALEMELKKMNKIGTNINAHCCDMDKCEHEGDQVCTVCKSTYYCGRKHQKLHWKLGHQDACVLIVEVNKKRIQDLAVAAAATKEKERVEEEKRKKEQAAAAAAAKSRAQAVSAAVKEKEKERERGREKEKERKKEEDKLRKVPQPPSTPLPTPTPTPTSTPAYVPKVPMPVKEVPAHSPISGRGFNPLTDRHPTSIGPNKKAPKIDIWGPDRESLCIDMRQFNNEELKNTHAEHSLFIAKILLPFLGRCMHVYVYACL